MVCEEPGVPEAGLAEGPSGSIEALLSQVAVLSMAE